MTQMTFSLKMTVDQANHIKQLLENDMKQQEKWIVAQQTTDDERTQAQASYARSEQLLRQF